MPKIAERMTEKSSGQSQKRPLVDGTIGKYFVLIDQATKRVFPLGRYPKLSLSEVFKKAAE